MNQAFICDAIRTPIGRYGGTLAAVRADDLGALVEAIVAEARARPRLSCRRPASRR